jgi:hypothetical protein
VAVALDKAGARFQGVRVRLALACLAGVLVYPVVSWLARLALTVLTLPVAGVARDAALRLPPRAMRVGGGAVCGAVGMLGAQWLAGALGWRGAWVLPGLLLTFVAFAHVPGLRRLAGGPQARDEALGFAGEALGVVAVALARWPW